MEIQFLRQRHVLWTGFDIFVVTYRVTNFLPELVDMLLFSAEKTEFPFLVCPYFPVMPSITTVLSRTSLQSENLHPFFENVCETFKCNATPDLS